MKSGRTLQELATELDRQAKSKKDFLADTRKLKMVPDDSDIPERRVVLEGVNGGMRLRAIAHGQLASTLGIPKPYYDRMLETQPDLLAINVNRWLETQPARKLIRTLDGSVRAILSDSYRPLDNYDLAEAILPKLSQLEATVLSGEITESRFYLKAVTEKVSGAVKVGDVIQAGLAISNSEVGQGSLRVDELDYRLVCLNGMIRASAIRKAHLGRGARGMDAIEDAREYYRDETRAADDRAFFLKVQDAAAAMFDEKRFMKRIEQYIEAGAQPATKEPEAVVELTAKRFGLTDTERTGVLRHLLVGGDMSKWGLANAITRASQDVESYDRATELENLGGAVIELGQRDWTALAV